MNFKDIIHQPKLRLQSPISLQTPDSHPRSPMISCVFHQITPEELADQNKKLIFDPFSPVADLSNEDPKFSGDFESGNIGQVFKIGKNKYEIHLIPDPNEQKTCQWFFFKVKNLVPGDYIFVLAGFYRQCNLHYKGSQICCLSENKRKQGVGWQRIGDDMNFFKWKNGKYSEWALSFKFNVEENDTMYFAHSYPYTYTDLMNCLNELKPLCLPSNLCKSFGGIDVPCIFWDADEKKCVDINNFLKECDNFTHEPPIIRDEEISEFSQYIIDKLKQWGKKNLKDGIKHNKKPVFVIAARIHPGEANSSYAMEGLLRTIFAKNECGEQMRKYSWLIIPMMNPDGVICGFYRPSLSCDDMNRVWRNPEPHNHIIAYNILNLLTVIQKTYPIPFFLDFHGHTAACNSFVYGFMNDNNPNLYKSERIFPLLMTKHSQLFSNEMCSYLKQEDYEGTMRVVLRRKFLILFSYTLEMSFGGSDFGPRKGTQFTPHDFRSIGEATALSINELFTNHTTIASNETFKLMPFPEITKQSELITNNSRVTIQENSDHKTHYFSFGAADITTAPPEEINLVLNQK